MIDSPLVVYSTTVVTGEGMVRVYWLMKSAVAAVRVTWTVPVPASEPAPEMTVVAVGASVLPLFTVRVPPTSKFEVALKVPVPFKVRLLNLFVPVSAAEASAVTPEPEV